VSTNPTPSSPRPPSAGGPPVVGQTVRFARDPLALIEEVVDEYGPVSRMSVLGVGEFYNLASPDCLERALVTERDAFAKSPGFRVAFGENVLSTAGEQWERQREALDEFFYPARIREYAGRMVELTERRLDRWPADGRLSLHEEMSGTALDNFFGTLFDRPLDPDGDERLRRAASNINLWFKPTSFALPRWVPTPARRRFGRAVETVEREARRLLDERSRAVERGEAEAGDDLLSTLVALREADGEEATLSDAEIVDQVVGLVFAGHDTTALAMTYALHQIGAHPEVRERFHAELADVLDGGRPTLSDLGDLAVTERILNETLRLYPPIHTIPRVTTRPVEMADYRLESDTRAHLSVWAVQRDERYWGDPHEWRPARWRDTSPQDAGYAYAPFGAGPRLCLGRRFALLEAKLVLALVGQRFELDPEDPLSFEPMTTTQPAHGVPVLVHER
jgi:cytochrome P450